MAKPSNGILAEKVGRWNNFQPNNQMTIHMQEPLSNIKSTANRLFGLSELKEWFQTRVMLEKLNNPVGLLFLGCLSVLLAILIGTQGTTSVGILVISGIIGIPLVMASLFNLRFGILLVVFISFVVLEIKRFNYSIPIGLMMDVLVIVMFMGLFIKQIRERDWSFARGPVSFMILIWILYNLSEVANPVAASRLAWVYTIRSMAGIMLLYFVTLFAVDSLKLVKQIFAVLLTMCLVVALYTFWQEFIGFSDAEWHIIQNDPELFGLLFQGGKFRKFSILDPVTLGIVMAYGSVICFVLMMGPNKGPTRLLYAFLGLLMAWAMIYSGTRTAFILLPAGLVFYTLLSLNRSAVIVMSIGMVLGVGVLLMPTVNSDHYRIKTAFSIFTGDAGAYDASFAVRVENQKKMQPWIRRHPIGGGLGSVGAWGKRFSPGTFLSNFPPDSGYMRIAVETGWLGLILYLSLLFVIMKTGIRNYFKSRDPAIKTYYMALLTMIFMLMIGNYPQEAITQLPTSVVFIVAVALLVKLKDLDPTLIETHQTQS